MIEGGKLEDFDFKQAHAKWRIDKDCVILALRLELVRAYQTAGDYLCL